MVNINDFEQFTLGKVRLLLVIPSRFFFTPNTLLDKQSNSYVKKMINDEVNAEWKEEVNAERMEEYCSLNCWYVVVHVYAVLCKQTVVYRNVHNHEYIMLNLKVHNICTVSGMTLGARVRCLIYHIHSFCLQF